MGTGVAYPAEVAANSSCDWPLLGALTGRLQLRSGQVLADVGCGTGGIGLWPARALKVQRVGPTPPPTSSAVNSAAP